MKVVHYTNTSSSPFKLHSITIKNGGGGRCPPTKPLGGLWCSSLSSKWGWRDWCKAENYGDINHKQKVVLDVDIANFVIIDSVADMETKLPWYETHGSRPAIDFEALVSQGVDGVHLTEKGQAATRFSYPKSLYGWDCETILILNEGCIKKVIVEHTKDGRKSGGKPM